MGEHQLVNRKRFVSSLANELVEPFNELSKKTRITKTRLLDEAIEDLLKKYELKYSFAPRPKAHPRRGNPLSSLHRTPPRPSGSHREPAGTLSHRPPYSNFARTCKVAAKASFCVKPGAARSLFGADKKRMGGASPVETAPWREPVSPGG